MSDKHTTEPWPEDLEGIVSLGDDGGCDDPDCCGGANYHVEISLVNRARIVFCVNALAGVEKPEKAILLAKEALDDAAACLERLSLTTPGVVAHTKILLAIDLLGGK